VTASAERGPTLHAVAAAPAADADAARRALMLQAVVLSHAAFARSATAFATELAGEFGCARVTLGFVRRGNIELAAVSHGAGEALVGAGFDAIAAAMDEAVQQTASLCLPVRAGARSAIRIAHTRLLQRHGGAVASVPLIHAGEVVGALTCEWSAEPADAAQRVGTIETIASLVGPVLNLMRLRETPLRERALSTARRGWRRLRDVSDRRVQAGIVAALAILVLLCALPAPYRVGGHARIEGALQRALVAPSDGFLKVVHVRPGDRIKQGQLLVEMADQDLLLQRRKWVSELAQQESANAVALARSDRSALVVAMARAEQARAQLALVDADIARSGIVAPFDGVVIQGDLAQSIGSPVERGKPLLLVAPGEAFRVVVEVDERDVAELHAGQKGSLSLAALPWDALPITVSRITPIARAVDGNNVFEVEAEIAPGRQRVRPGLEGVAKIDVAQRPLAWGWTHRLVEWLRLKAWAWWT
jgi:hypothetical protein